MDNSFNDILNALLEEYDKNPTADINDLGQMIAQKMNLQFNPDQDKEALELIDSFTSSYNDLINKKENKGVSTESWMKKKISESAAKAGLNGKEDEVMNLIAQAIETNNNETLEKID